MCWVPEGLSPELYYKLLSIDCKVHAYGETDVSGKVSRLQNEELWKCRALGIGRGGGRKMENKYLFPFSIS